MNLFLYKCSLYSGSTDCTVVQYSLFREYRLYCSTRTNILCSGSTDCTVVQYYLFRQYRLYCSLLFSIHRDKLHCSTVLSIRYNRLYCSLLFSIQRVQIVLQYTIFYSEGTYCTKVQYSLFCTAVRYYLFRKYRMYCSTVLSIQVVQIVLNYVELELGTSVLVPPLTGIHYHRFLNIKNLQMLNNLFQFCNCPFFLNRILNVISIIPLLKDRMACPLSMFFSLKCGNF